MKKRLNIGLFIDSLDAVFTREACKGAQLGAIALDANMFVYPGGYLDADDISNDHLKFEYQYNAIFQFVTKNQIDVLYIMMGMIGGRTTLEDRIKFLERYLDIPVVQLYTRMDGYPSVIFDNKVGFKRAVYHLIIEHKLKKVGFVSGPKTNVDAMERMEVYKEVLAEAGIPYNEKYVTYGNFEESSERVIRKLVEDNPDLEGIVFANDRMAHGGYWAFEKMGIKVGVDLLCVSFDNSVFSSTLNPPLTTVEANAAELAYQAITHAESFLETNEIDDFKIATRFVRRSSCGCHRFDYESMYEQLGFGRVLSADGVQMNRIHNYLFGEYAKFNTIQKIKDDLSEYIELMIKMVKEKDFENYEKELDLKFIQIINEPLLQFTTVELFFNVLQSLQSGLENLLPDPDDRIRLMKFFSRMYRSLAIANCQVVQDQQASIEQMSHLINNMTVSASMMESNNEIPYEKMLENIHGLGLKSGYLYTFQETIKHEKNDGFVPPKKLLFRAYSNEDGSHRVPVEEQLISIDNICNHKYIDDSHRKTMVLSPLFSGTNLFGLFLCEVDYENFHNVTPVAFQLSAVIKSLLLIENQQEVQRSLEISLMAIRKNNELLDEISKSDELTGLYNRRGFLEYTRNAIADKKNKGKKALIVYADMDNLKLINDEYGHDDGDFALKEIAQILKEAFRGTDIVGRYGGDEFVAFAMVGVDDYENIMRKRIEEITALHNKESGKPYQIEMSMGICQFTCDPEVNMYDKIDYADERLYEDKRRRHTGR